MRDEKISNHTYRSEVDSNTGTARRSVLKAAAAGSLPAAFSALFTGDGAARQRARRQSSSPSVDQTDDGSVFPQSVASGGPTQAGVILWTRISPDRYDPKTSLHVEVAHDRSFDSGDIAYRGTVPADDLGPEFDYTVNVDTDGQLQPNRSYYYRFVYDGVSSRVGQCQTLPDSESQVDSVTFVMATCNDYRDGYYGAYRHIAREDADFMLHLGDFIYESDGDGNYPGREVRLPDNPSGDGNADTLADFRAVWRTYRSDEAMQRALEKHTLIVTMDDHEIINNRYWNYDTEAPETTSHEWGEDPERMRLLTARGLKAFTEYVPARVFYDPTQSVEETAGDIHDSFRLYHSLQFGDLLELFVSDTRLYRSPPPADEFGQRDVGVPPSRAAADADRTMLGDAQYEWLTDGVSTSDAIWKGWMNSVHATPLSVAAGPATSELNYDAWGGYQYERDELMDVFADTDNVISLTGDLHGYLVSYLLADYESFAEVTPEGVPPDERAAVEFMTPAISSSTRDDGSIPREVSEEGFDNFVRSNNPHIQWINVSRWGYSKIEFNRTGATYDAYEVDKSDPSPDPEKRVLRRYHVPEGETEIQEYRRLPLQETLTEAIESRGESALGWEGGGTIAELIDDLTDPID